MENESKFRRATESVLDASELPAPEMARKDYSQIRKNLLNRYSHPIKQPEPIALEEAGYQKLIMDDGIIYSGEHDTIIFDQHGKVKEHWHWPEGRASRHLSYAAYDHNGYVQVEEERHYNPAVDAGDRSRGSHRTSFDYEEKNGEIVLAKVRYRTMQVLPNLHVSPHMLNKTEYVIDLKDEEVHRPHHSLN